MQSDITSLNLKAIYKNKYNTIIKYLKTGVHRNLSEPTKKPDQKI
jgi:hypothetical protein